ncbi:hypothetical protein ABBQ32_000517 [Trebouxia sp. C0010 RCD-2024]
MLTSYLPSSRMLFKSWSPSYYPCQRGQSSSRRVQSQALVTDLSAQDIILESDLGTMGYMNLTSTPARDDTSPLEGLSLSSVQEMNSQSVSQGAVEAHLYTGRVNRGKLQGTRVLLKMYPHSSQDQTDILAANEVGTHIALQQRQDSPHIYHLLGGFEVQDPDASPGREQWLVFRRDGSMTAATWAQKAAEATASNSSIGDGEFMDMFEPQRRLFRRQAFIRSVLRQAMQGLAFMHANSRLHQSIGPGSVVINKTDEREVRVMQARLRDLAFAVDVSNEAMVGGATLAEIWDQGTIAKPDPKKELASPLWARARQAGAYSDIERRNFGIADDIYAAGLLLAYMAFIPFCEPGSIDGPSLQRLFENTFQLDVLSARDFCEADDRWAKAVQFLDADGRAGWELLAAMLNSNWRLRPTAQSCLVHRFLSS